MNILINNNTVTAIIDGALYTRTFESKEIEEITALVFKYQAKQSEENKKSIKDYLAIDKESFKKVQEIEGKVIDLQKKILMRNQKK